MTKPDDKTRKRRQLLLKNTSIATIGYGLPILALFVVKALDIASYTYTNLIIIVSWVALSRLVSYFIIKKSGLSRPHLPIWSWLLNSRTGCSLSAI